VGFGRAKVHFFLRNGIYDGENNQEICLYLVFGKKRVTYMRSNFLEINTMKQLIAILSGILLLSNAGAQTLIDSVAYEKGLDMIAASIPVQDYENAGKYFDDLLSSKPQEWLAPVYAGLCYVLASFHETDGKLKDELCDRAQVFLDSADLRNADESETASVQAFLYQARIDVSPMERGLEYSLKADIEVKKAESANPNDPRPYFLYAMNVYYTPKLFGGGPEKALPLFEEAADKFRAFKPVMPFMPHWGEQQNLEMIEKCKGTAGESENR
jgi:hypothetical protein